jgi:hypothetical protein
MIRFRRVRAAGDALGGEEMGRGGEGRARTFKLLECAARSAFGSYPAPISGTAPPPRMRRILISYFSMS